MSADRLITAIKRHSTAAHAKHAEPSWGIVTSVDPTRPAAKVALQPSGVLTGWLPIVLAGAGGAFTLATIPVPGWQAYLSPEAGTPNDWVIIGFAHSDQQTFPQVPNTNGSGGTPNTTNAAPVAGETIAKGPGGLVMRFCANGDVYFKPGSGKFLVDGDVYANGDVYDRHGSLDRLRGNYDAHKHGGVQTGSGTTGNTDHNDPE